MTALLLETTQGVQELEEGRLGWGPSLDAVVRGQRIELCEAENGLAEQLLHMKRYIQRRQIPFICFQTPFRFQNGV